MGGCFSIPTPSSESPTLREAQQTYTTTSSTCDIQLKCPENITEEPRPTATSNDAPPPHSMSSNDVHPTTDIPCILTSMDVQPPSPQLHPHMLISIMSDGSPSIAQRKSSKPNAQGSTRLVTFADQVVPIEGSGRSSLSDNSRLLRSVRSEYPLSPQMQKFLLDAERFAVSNSSESNTSTQ